VTCNPLKEEVLGQFGDFFTFYMNEVTAYEELLMKKKSVDEQMENAERKLAKKKEQRFEFKNTATWELDSSSLCKGEQILIDKGLAFREMLPRESQEGRRLRMVYRYYTNKDRLLKIHLFRVY
jgi:hypothetical protein